MSSGKLEIPRKHSCKDGLDKGQKWMDLTEAEKEVARIHRRTLQKRSSQPRKSRWYDHSPRARHPGM